MVFERTGNDGGLGIHINFWEPVLDFDHRVVRDSSFKLELKQFERFGD